MISAYKCAHRRFLKLARSRATLTSRARFQLTGVAYVFRNVTFIFTNGKATEIGGTLLPLVNVYIFALVILVGRLWRAVPAVRQPFVGRGQWMTPSSSAVSTMVQFPRVAI